MPNDNAFLTIHSLYDANLKLLGLAREEKWNDFIMQVEDYIIGLSQFIESSIQQSVEEKAQLSQIIGKLVDNEKEMTERLRGRMKTLTKEMSSLQRGKKYAEAYSLQMSQCIH